MPAGATESATEPDRPARRGRWIRFYWQVRRLVIVVLGSIAVALFAAAFALKG